MNLIYNLRGSLRKIKKITLIHRSDVRAWKKITFIHGKKVSVETQDKNLGIG